jgi:hypothetical protein
MLASLAYPRGRNNILGYRKPIFFNEITAEISLILANT